MAVERLEAGGARPVPVEAPARAPALRPQVEGSRPVGSLARVAEPEGGRGGEAAERPQPQALPALVDQLNLAARYLQTSLRFELEEGRDPRVRVIDTNTGQVVKAIPPDTLVDAVATMRALVGLLLDVRM